jgi:hypothetical protein
MGGCGSVWFFGLGCFPVRVGMGKEVFFVVELCWMGGMRMGKFMPCIILLPIKPVKKYRLAILP